MSRLAIVELHKEELKFSAGHFMIFSETKRESMHGHDYQVQVAFHTLVKKNGLAFDLRLYKQKVLELCQQLDYRFILPAESQYLKLEEETNHWHVYIGTEKITFLKRDTIVLPLTNVTMEELSNWFLIQLTANRAQLKIDAIQSIMVKVFNGRGESAATTWEHAFEFDTPQGSQITY